MRHHLKELEAEGLILYQREHRGVGAPVFAYSLSSAGAELFPRRYGEALSAMLSAVVERDGREAAVGMLESYFDLLAGRMRAELVGIPQAERLGVVARLLSQEGYMAEALVEQGAGDPTRRCSRSITAPFRPSRSGSRRSARRRSGTWRTCWEPRWSGSVTS